MILHAGHVRQKAHSWFVGCARDRRQYREAWREERSLKWHLADRLTHQASRLAALVWAMGRVADTQSLVDIGVELHRVAEWRERLTVFK